MEELLFEALKSIEIGKASESFFAGCIVYESKVPVRGSNVFVSGSYPMDWNNTSITDEGGCFTIKVLADADFNLKAQDPKEGYWAEYNGTLKSKPTGELLFGDKYTGDQNGIY